MIINNNFVNFFSLLSSCSKSKIIQHNKIHIWSDFMHYRHNFFVSILIKLYSKLLFIGVYIPLERPLHNFFIFLLFKIGEQQEFKRQKHEIFFLKKICTYHITLCQFQPQWKLNAIRWSWIWNEIVVAKKKIFKCIGLTFNNKYYCQ